MEDFWTRFIRKKKKETIISMLILLVALGIYCLFAKFFCQKIELGYVVFLLILIIALPVRHGLFIFRVRRGYYGETPDECREVLEEIIERENQ